MAQAKRTCVVIAGMHRSGTSALARVLNLLGCGLADELLGALPSNETGHWEPVEILKLNDELLESAGSAWDDWTACSPDWFGSPVAAEFKERAARIFESEHGSQRLTVMKDPRLARLLPFWLDSLRSLDIAPLVMLPIRNPLEVAQSLHVRDGSEPFYNQLLWLRHVLDAESGSRNIPRHFSTYDQLLENWTSLISAAEQSLGFKFPRRSARTSEEIDAYLAANHRHQQTSPNAILNDTSASDWIKATYAIMLKWADSGEDAHDYAELDRIRSELNQSAGTFSRIIYRGKRASEEARVLRNTLAERDQFLAELQRDLDHARGIASNLQNEIATWQSQANADQMRANGLQGELDSLRVEFDAERVAARETIDSAQSRLDQTLAQLHALTEEAAATRSTLQAQVDDLESRLQQSQAELAAQTQQLETVRSMHVAEQSEVEARHQSLVSNLQGSLAQEQEFNAALRDQIAQSLQTLETTKAEAEAELHAKAEAYQAAEANLMAELDKEKSIVKGLTDHVALLLQDLEAAKQEYESSFQARSAELTASQSNLQAVLQELDDAQAARAKQDAEVERLTSDLAQLESAMRQRGAELDDVSGELKRVMDLLHIERHERARIDKVVDGLKAHVKLLMEDVDTREADLAAKARDIQKLEAESALLRSQATEIKSRMKSVADGLVQGLINEPHHFFQTKGANLRRKAAILRSAKLLDAQEYLAANPDVAAAGVDPAIHYLTAGFAEGRRRGSS